MQSVPHRCPVCRGKGRVKLGFYLDDPEQAVCRGCSGNGILWGWDYAPVVIPAFTIGWTCTTCGGWIPAGTLHQCPTRWVYPGTQWSWTVTTSASDEPPSVALAPIQ